MSRKLIHSSILCLLTAAYGNISVAAESMNSLLDHLKPNDTGRLEGSTQNTFATPKDQQGEGNHVQPPVKERILVDTDQLQKMIDKFSESDKKVLNAIKVQIATWPQEVFNEISAYREFIIDARKVAEKKYLALSPEAKKALESEKKLKEQLSPETVHTLSTLNVTASH